MTIVQIVIPKTMHRNTAITAIFCFFVVIYSLHSVSLFKDVMLMYKDAYELFRTSYSHNSIIIKI